VWVRTWLMQGYQQSLSLRAVMQSLKLALTP
jgi:hypothetical protein